MNKETLIEVFECRYLPAESIEDAEELLTSNEMINMFSSVVKIDKDELFELLKLRGFKLELVDQQFVWLLKEKKPE